MSPIFLKSGFVLNKPLLNIKISLQHEVSLKIDVKWLDKIMCTQKPSLPPLQVTSCTCYVL